MGIWVSLTGTWKLCIVVVTFFFFKATVCDFFNN